MGKGPFSGWFRRQMDLAAFRKHVALAITGRMPEVAVENLGRDGLSLVRADEATVSLNLARLHSVYRSDPSQLDRIVESLTSLVSDEAPAIRPEDVFVLVRPDGFISSPIAPEHAQLCRHVAGELWAIVAAANPVATGFPSGSQLRADLGLDDEAIWALALENSRRKLAPFRLPGPNAIWVITDPEGEAASYLADEALWGRLDAEATSGVLVVPLEKNALMVVGSFHPDAALALPEATALAADSPDRLSSVALTRRDGRWIEAAELNAAFAPSGFKH